jgi:hypothetical protein
MGDSNRGRSWELDLARLRTVASVNAKIGPIRCAAASFAVHTRLRLILTNHNAQIPPELMNSYFIKASKATIKFT